MSAPRLYLIVNLLCVNVGPLPDTCSSGVQVKLLSVLSHQKHCTFYLETGLPGVLHSLRTVSISGLDKGAKRWLRCPAWAQRRSAKGHGGECGGGQAPGGIPESPSEWCLLLCMDSLTHGHAVSNAHPWVLEAKLFSPPASFSDASGLGKGSWVTAAVWRPRSPTYALFQKLSLTICPLRTSPWDGSFCFRLLAFV